MSKPTLIEQYAIGHVAGGIYVNGITVEHTEYEVEEVTLASVVVEHNEYEVEELTIADTEVAE